PEPASGPQSNEKNFRVLAFSAARLLRHQIELLHFLRRPPMASVYPSRMLAFTLISGYLRNVGSKRPAVQFNLLTGTLRVSVASLQHSQFQGNAMAESTMLDDKSLMRILLGVVIGGVITAFAGFNG